MVFIGSSLVLMGSFGGQFLFIIGFFFGGSFFESVLMGGFKLVMSGSCFVLMGLVGFFSGKFFQLFGIFGGGLIGDGVISGNSLMLGGVGGCMFFMFGKLGGGGLGGFFLWFFGQFIGGMMNDDVLGLILLYI